MELRRVDPRILKANPTTRAKSSPANMSDAALGASIKAVGILQPPAVYRKEWRAHHRLRRPAGPHRHTDRPPRDRRPGQRPRRERPDAGGERKRRARAHGHGRPLALHREPRLRELDRRGHRLRARHSCPPDPQAAAAGDSPSRHPRSDRRGRHATRAGASHHRLRLARGSGCRLEEVQTEEGRGRPSGGGSPRRSKRPASSPETPSLAKTSARHSASSGRKTCSPRATRTIGSPSTAKRSSPPSAHGSTPTCRRTACWIEIDEYGREKLPPKAQAHLDEAEEGRPDRLLDPSARRHGPRSRLPHARARDPRRAAVARPAA